MSHHETEPTLIHLVRHGAVHNPLDLYYGRLPGFRLSEEGCCQAWAVARAFQEEAISAVFSSPLLRGLQTAEIILAFHLDLTLEVSPLLNEVRSPFDGQPKQVVAVRKWDVYTGVGPEYEQFTDVLARAQQFAAKARHLYKGQQVLAATHGDVIASLMLWAQGMPLTPEQKQALYHDYLAPGSITTFTYQGSSIDEVPTLEYRRPCFSAPSRTSCAAQQ